jgi:signal transduction histidine kinase
VPEQLPLVMADDLALRQVMQNLLENAAKYGINGDPWIGVSAGSIVGTGGPFVEIRVRDHGQGISENERKYIFDAFFSGERAVQDQIHGTGLGLNLVKQIVEAHAEPFN